MAFLKMRLGRGGFLDCFFSTDGCVMFFYNLRLREGVGRRKNQRQKKQKNNGAVIEKALFIMYNKIKDVRTSQTKKGEQRWIR